MYTYLYWLYSYGYLYYITFRSDILVHVTYNIPFNFNIMFMLYVYTENVYRPEWHLFIGLWLKGDISLVSGLYCYLLFFYYLLIPWKENYANKIITFWFNYTALYKVDGCGHFCALKINKTNQSSFISKIVKFWSAAGSQNFWEFLLLFFRIFWDFRHFPELVRKFYSWYFPRKRDFFDTIPLNLNLKNREK